MNKLILIAGVLLTLGLFTGCNKSDDLVNNQIDSTTNFTDVTGPALTSVTGTMGYTNPANPSRDSYPTFIRGEYLGGTTITIAGTGLGPNKGNSTFIFEQNINNVWSVVPNYSIRIVSWVNNKIVITLTSALNAVPVSNGRFRVVTNNGSYSGSATVPVKVVPFINERQYHQCTNWVSRRTIEKGFPYQNAIYANVNSTINANYVPTAWDILSWGTNVHEAFIESVTVSTEPGNITVYRIQISEENVNNVNPTTYYTTVKVKTTGTVKSFVPGYGSYRSTMSSGALYYKAQ